MVNDTVVKPVKKFDFYLLHRSIYFLGIFSGSCTYISEDKAGEIFQMCKLGADKIKKKVIALTVIFLTEVF